MKQLLRLTALVALAVSSLAHAEGLERRVNGSGPQRRHHAIRSTAEINSAEEMRRIGQLKMHHADEKETSVYNGMQGVDSTLNVIQGHNPGVKVDASSKDEYVSPDFYPTPQVQGTGKWKEAVQKAKKYVKRFDTEERVALVTGVGWNRGPR